MLHTADLQLQLLLTHQTPVLAEKVCDPLDLEVLWVWDKGLEQLLLLVRVQLGGQLEEVVGQLGIMEEAEGQLEVVERP